MRIAVGGIMHETATFIHTPTTFDDFQRGFGLYRGDEIAARFASANMCIGGFLQAAGKLGFEAVPLLWGFAYPSGLVTRNAYDRLKGELLDRLRQAMPVEGVLLDLHGAMVVEGIDDADGDVVESVRGVVGPDVPIVVTTDLHSNHTQRRVAASTAIVGYDTYPHIDMAERGREAAEIMVRTLRGEIQPATALRQIPLFWSAPCQVTAHPPMDEVLRRVHELEQRPGMVAVTIATGFPWADVPDVGASVIAVSDNDPALARRAADELGDWIWQHRERWHKPPVSVREALAAGEQAGRFPIILADHCDNTGGGAPGDSTEILHTFLELRLRDALLLYMVDPDVARQAHAAGVGRRIRVSLGGKSDSAQGPPVEAEAEIKAISNGQFAYDGPMYAGLTGNMGTSAWLQIGGVAVVVVTAREQPLDPAFARSLGIDCGQMKYIGVKSAAHFRSGFESLAGAIYNVDARAILTHDLARLPYRRRTRPMFPTELGPA
jgi:microcystin degradation protein MlrC